MVRLAEKPSREEAALWCGEDDPERSIGRLLALGPRIVAIKMGAAGALVRAQGDAVPRHIPVYPVEARDPTGAGDAFCGGFAARRSQGAGPYEAALAGAVASSFAVERHGSLGMLDVERAVAEERLATLRSEMEEAHAG
jgi:ribokinase